MEEIGDRTHFDMLLNCIFRNVDTSYQIGSIGYIYAEVTGKKLLWQVLLP